MDIFQEISVYCPKLGRLQEKLLYNPPKKRSMAIIVLVYELTSKYENDRNVRIALVF